MVKEAVAGYPVYSFLGLRFAVATVAFLVLFPSTLRRIDRDVIRVGLIAGVMLTAGYVFQTLGLTLTTLIFTWLLAIPIGVYSATHQYSKGDYFFTFLGFIGLAIPSFMIALVLMWVAFRYLGSTDTGCCHSND